MSILILKKKKRMRRRMTVAIQMTLNGKLLAGLGCDRGYVDRMVINMVRATINKGAVS
jgi:hypothetical protein